MRTVALILLLGVLSAAQSQPRTVHVFVALADNQFQGIVPVPRTLGNGDDPKRNLYWGAAFGVRTYFDRSKDWKLLHCGTRPKPSVLERCIFRHKSQNAYLLADAYRGREIKQATTDFLSAAAGAPATTTTRDGTHDVTLNIAGAANLIAYIGHDGLMDFQLPALMHGKPDVKRHAVILACASKQYFTPALKASGAYPLLWTTNLMAPEAYILKDALDGWLADESHEQIRERAAAAYDRYQKTGIRAARRLFATGW